MKVSKFQQWLWEYYLKGHPYSARAYGSLLYYVLDRSLKPERLPDHGESVAVASENPKTAALCYDRIIDFFDDVPEPLLVRIHTKEYLLLQWAQIAREDDVAANFPPGEGNSSADLEAFFKRYWGVSSDPGQHYLPPSEAMKFLARQCSESLWLEYGLPATPVYASTAQREAQYKEGNFEVLTTTLSDLEIVDEQSTPWDAIRQFREDKEAQRKYRRLIHWLSADMVGKSQAFIEDAIAIKLEDYNWALRKHGIKTVLGAISETLNPRSLLATGAAGLTAGLLSNQPGLGLLTQGFLLVGKASVSLATALLDHEDAKRGANNEVAWVYEAQKRLGKR
ncbi:MAG: hypothetical protein ACYS6K_18300 [Planctomycetota bacterium]|jgi:hypothetical protein